MKRHVFTFLILLTLATLPIAGLAYSSNICNGGAECDPPQGGSALVCHECEVGKFMVGISADCGNNGKCELTDLMIVVGDVGNFVVGIVGVALLVTYIYGGFKIMTSQGGPGLATGKKVITGATFGFVIVLIAYIGVYWIVDVIKDPNYSAPVEEVDSCKEPENEGKQCDYGSQCKNGACIEKCSIVNQGFSCVEIDDTEAAYLKCLESLCSPEQWCCPPP